jgi:protein SCO1/2
VSRRAAALPLLLVLLAGCGGGGEKAAPPAATAGSATRIEPPVHAPDFLLRDQDGKLVGPQLYRGRWTVVTFLYTRCPDVCPLIADHLAAAQRRARSLQVVAVSVDPAHDTPAAVRRFLAAHRTGPRFRYVTGTRRELARVWRRYHIAVLPVPGGTVSHSAASILVDPRGREQALFTSRVTARDVLSALAS